MEETINLEQEIPIKMKWGISGSTLKIVAIIAMLIDHTAATILERMLSTNANELLYWVYFIMRLIGRIGFPIFCFLLVEGFLHTKNKVKYTLRLGAFAFISEIPFDLALFGKAMNFDYQNVFFTLWIGMLVMIGIQFIESKKEISVVPRVAMNVLLLVVGMLAGYFLKRDYGYWGVLTIVIMYFFRKRKMLSTTLGCVTLTVMSLMEITAFFAMIPIYFYNGTRGIRMKYFFYLFYPVHLLILYLICVYMGIL